MRITVKEAAQMLGVSEQYIRLGLQQNRLPIGTAVKMSSVWTYYITREWVEEFIKKVPTAGTADTIALQEQKGQHEYIKY